MTPRTGQDFSLYVVTDSRLSQGRSHEEVARLAFQGGATVVQLRDKEATALDLYRAGLRIRAVASQAGGLFIMNDRIDLALSVDADGVHMGQDDLPAAVARRLLGPNKVLGVSVENGAQARKAEADGATYVAIGPIYEARGTKTDAGAPVGPEAVSEIKRHTGLPVVAIGGIKHKHISEVFRAGADGAAVVSAVVGAEDITAACSEMRRLIAAARR